jgi:5-epi-alpha-selinene synthase
MSISMLKFPPCVDLRLPWSYQRHPQAAEHEKRALQVASEFGLVGSDNNGRDRKRFEAFVKLDAYVYPYPNAERLRIAGEFNQWLFFLDDQCDNHLELGPNPPLVRRLMERSMDVLSTGRLPQDANAFDRFTLHVRQSLISICPDDWFARFLSDVHDYLFRGSLVAIEHWAAARTPSLDDYVMFRLYDSGCLPAIDVIEVAAGLNLPPAVLGHPLICELRILAARYIAYINDIFSYHKEVVENRTPCNLVHVIVANDLVSLEEAISAAFRLVNDYLGHFEKIEMALPDWGPTLNEEVQRYLHGMKTWMRGNVDFSISSGRYQAPWLVTNDRPAMEAGAVAADCGIIPR